MAWLGRFYGSTIGKKIVMAVTGVLLVGFVIGHVTGNLLIYRGPEALNNYSAFLKSSAVVLWSVRSALLVAVGLHIHSAYSLTRLARAARPARYNRLRTQADTWSARTMRVGGVVLLVFIVFHILHYTTGTVHPAFDEHDVYGNELVGFHMPWVVAFYVVAMVALGLHLHHGIWSMLQTLGINHPQVNAGRRRIALVIAVLVAGGFIAIPLGVAFGLVR